LNLSDKVEHSSRGLKPSLSAWKPLRGWRIRHLTLCRGRRVDPARRACPTSDRASARWGARRWDAPARQGATYL